MASPTRSNPTPKSDSATELNPGTGLNPPAGLSPGRALSPAGGGSPAGTVGPAGEAPPHPDPAPDSEQDRVTTLDPGVAFDHLLELFQEVIAARAALTVARRAPLGRSRLVDAPRARLLVALEAYTAELNSRNLPVPYSIRDDLRIQRRILGRSAGASG
jgi:hypothetical protein